MSRLVLHLLLSLALLLNGLGAAQASMPMATPPAAHAKASHALADVSGHDAAPCHETRQPSAPEEQGPLGCCESGACVCGCIGHVQLLPDATMLLAARIAHAGSARSMSLGRPAPALPHLIRPPID